MNKNYLWIAIILSFLIVAPFSWYFGTPSLFVALIRMITEFALYFIGILSVLYFIQYLRQRSEHEKQIIELLQKITEKQTKNNL
ncbi:hypothetical protein AT261_21505 [Bacillus cereus]|nr:hypothetical protein AT261_21505 [Bacillus cereus]